ncbi:hypothetical protein SAMN05428989_4037 [Pseudoxanthomonas sp. GM95]|uniref:NADPH-dependent F420 reductase n=1 Tax=Pseudoxanthomonas sp. GM95 TaxID=1881043 RepID=UPI0008D4F2D1|nr:NADPH-dependent F420 reductase [Pseudoxanthomonas sp. GM95]SEM54442.1 hypothetical protein SAMN05428989_4037 [Pseudoxanthomonas sp. GM95]
MKYAVIGTGKLGTTYATAIAQAGLDLVIGARDPSHSAALAKTLGGEVEGGGICAAVKLADVILIALPYPATRDAMRKASDQIDLAGKILVDISNPVTPDYQDLQVGPHTSAAEALQADLPGTVVVKAFNTILAQLVPPEARVGRQLQVFLASDDDGARRQVAALATALDFRAVDAGPLRNSRYLESVGMMNIQFAFFLGAGTATAPAWSHA